jgi:hypothetical protein
MMTPNTLIAFDKQSARTVDAQGFLHVAGCNISKGIVNPYLGAEILGAAINCGCTARTIIPGYDDEEDMEEAS